MNLYINNSLYISNSSFLNPILNKIINKSNNLKNQIAITQHPESSDFWMLPLMWNYYVDNNKISTAHDLYQEACSAKQRLVIFSSGDFTANIPFNNVIVIQSSCYKSRDNTNEIKILAIPTFIDDYLQMYKKGCLQLREKGKSPIVDFCGQQNGTLLHYTLRQLYIISKQIKYQLNIAKWEPPNVEPSRFRHKTLLRLQENKSIMTNFILRTKYRAGYRPRKKDPFHSTRLDFIQNILDSDYTVCMRGGGNFSVRFYETFSLGRIPIFINTDCVLPLDEIIDYKEYMIWVEQEEIPYIAEKVIDFHESLSNNTFKDLQVECRNLWKDFLTKNGFFRESTTCNEVIIYRFCFCKNNCQYDYQLGYILPNQ